MRVSAWLRWLSTGILMQAACGDNGKIVAETTGTGGSRVVDGSVTCSSPSATTITGTAFAPNGTLPLYNALVFVPSGPLPPIAPTLTCDRCGDTMAAHALVSARTDALGHFTLAGPPVGKNVPLVIQVGKWRRQVSIPEVKPCQENALTDPELTRLPKNRSEGDLPRIAITTGACDNIICQVSKIGIDPDEWGISGEDKAVTFFDTGDVTDDGTLFDFVGLRRFDAHLQKMKPASVLWWTLDELKKYDIVLLSSECGEAMSSKGPPAFQSMTDYLNAGGRLFGTNYEYVWFKYSPDPAVPAAVRTIPMLPAEYGGLPLHIDTSFPKGKAFADWLKNLAPTQPYAELRPQATVRLTEQVSPPGQVWATSPADWRDEDGGASAMEPRVYSLNMPAGVPVDQQCGKSVHLDMRVNEGLPLTFRNFPDDCGPNFFPGEQVLAFFMFDLASCIQDDRQPPPK